MSIKVLVGVIDASEPVAVKLHFLNESKLFPHPAALSIFRASGELSGSCPEKAS
jgi:hypothetical protein